MLNIVASNQFKKDLKQATKRGLKIEKLRDVVNTLARQETLDEKYRDHMLKGEYAGFHECHIKPDWLLIYLIENDILTLTLVDTGSHADLFKM